MPEKLQTRGLISYRRQHEGGPVSQQWGSCSKRALGVLDCMFITFTEIMRTEEKEGEREENLEQQH